MLWIKVSQATKCCEENRQQQIFKLFFELDTLYILRVVRQPRPQARVFLVSPHGWDCCQYGEIKSDFLLGLSLYHMCILIRASNTDLLHYLPYIYIYALTYFLTGAGPLSLCFQLCVYDARGVVVFWISGSVPLGTCRRPNATAASRRLPFSAVWLSQHWFRFRVHNSGEAPHRFTMAPCIVVER